MGTPHPRVFTGKMKYKLSKGQSPQGHALGGGTAGSGAEGSPGPRGQSSLRSLSAPGLTPSCAVEMETEVPSPGPTPGCGGKEAPQDRAWEDRPCGDAQDRQLSGPSHALYSRFLVLIALQAAHFAHVHLGRVYVCVDHKLILANAAKGRRRVRRGAGGGRVPRRE